MRVSGNSWAQAGALCLFGHPARSSCQDFVDVRSFSWWWSYCTAGCWPRRRGEPASSGFIRLPGYIGLTEEDSVACKFPDMVRSWRVAGTIEKVSGGIRTTSARTREMAQLQLVHERRLLRVDPGCWGEWKFREENKGYGTMKAMA